jgi:hypothetical protein
MQKTKGTITKWLKSQSNPDYETTQIDKWSPTNFFFYLANPLYKIFFIVLQKNLSDSKIDILQYSEFITDFLHYYIDNLENISSNLL